MFFLLALIMIFSILAKRWVGKSVSSMTYLVSSGTLNLNSMNMLTLLSENSYLTGKHVTWKDETWIRDLMKVSMLLTVQLQ